MPAGRIGLRASLAALGGMFVLTGAVGLLAEQAFEKLLETLLGVTTPAGATVLAIYFGGLTLGAFGYAPLVRPRFSTPIRAYAFLEGAVGAWAVVLFLSFDRLVPAFAPVLRLGSGSFWLLETLRMVVAACWILPPTLCMGATFPAIVDVLQAWRVPRRPRVMARFYAFNLLGAFLGAVAGPTAAFPYLGVDGTLLAAAVVEALVALAAWALSARRALRKRFAAPKGPPAPVPARTDGRLLLVVAFASGFLFFALEVLWTHLIAAVLGNSVYAFSEMLAVVMAGLGLGAVLSSLWPESRGAVPAAVPGALFVAGAASLCLTHGLWPRVPHSLAVRGADLTSFWAGEALRAAHATLLLLPSATILGLCFPVLFRVGAFGSGDRARGAGRLVAVNAIGCVAGALSSGFGLLPGLGSEASLLVVLLLYSVSGVVISLRLVPGRQRFAMLAACLGVLFLGASRPPWDPLKLTSGEHVYFRPLHVTPESRLLLFHEDSYGGITTVVENPPGSRVLLTNGKFQGSDSGEMAAQVGFTLVPLLHLSSATDALVIGLGTGQSASVLGAWGVPEIDVAEVAPGIVAAARGPFARLNDRILERAHLFLEDGRNLLLLRPSRYDLITMEISSVWFMGSTNLYSREFYELARSRLKPGGILQQWIQLHHIGFEELGSAMATIRSVFPFVSFWVVGGQGILVASEAPLAIRSDAVRRLSEIAPSLGWEGDRLKEGYRALLSSCLLGPSALSRLVREERFRLNTDRNRYLEFFTPRYNLSRLPLDGINVRRLASFATSPCAALGPRVPPDPFGGVPSRGSLTGEAPAPPAR